MKLYLAKEFTEHDWYPNYQKIKKKLRKNRLPFTIRKLSTENGVLHSIWSTNEYIEQVRDLVSRHYLNDPKIRNQIYRTEALAQEFEDKWIKNIFIYDHSQSYKTPSVIYSSIYRYSGNGIISIFPIPLKMPNKSLNRTLGADAPPAR